MSDIKQLWQSQEREPDMIVLDEIRARSVKFRGRMRWRNVLIAGYSLCVVAALANYLVRVSHLAVLPPALPAVLLALLAQLWILFALWQRGRARALPENLVGEAALDFHRHELEKQRRAAATAWAWYILPCMPPYVFMAWFMMTHKALQPPAIMTVVALLTNVLFFAAIWLAFSRSAARLELELERFKRLRAE